MSGQEDYGRERDRSPSPRRDRSRSPMRVDERGSRDEDKSRGRPQAVDGNPGNNLHVSGLSTRVEDRDLEEVFSKFGNIQKCQVMRDPHTKDSRGFAFVTMETAEEAEAAIAGLSATELMGRTMNVEKARRGRARTPTPGQYHGPPKRDGFGPGPGGPRPYDRGPPGGYGGRVYDRPPAPYDDRYGGRYPPPRDDRYGGRYDDRAYGGRYDDRAYAPAPYAAPMRDDRRDYPPPRDARYDDRAYDRPYRRDDRPPRY